jgi:hypothetical protein
MRGNARARLARLEQQAGLDRRPVCPGCVQIRILEWRPGQPEPDTRCELCGGAAPALVVIMPGQPGAPDEPEARP